MPLPPGRSYLRVKNTEDGVRVNLLDCERMDEDILPAVREQLFALVERTGGVPLLLDMGAVHYLSSIGMGMLVSLHRKLKAAGGRLTLCNVPTPILDLLEITQLIRVLDVRRDGPAGP